MFWAACAYFTIERFGRRRMMLFGASGCSVCFAVAAAGLGVGGKAANGVAVAFIFLYYFFYVGSSAFLHTTKEHPLIMSQGLSLLAIPFLYPSEINSNRSRNRGAAIAMLTNWLCVYLIVSITPVGESFPEHTIAAEAYSLTSSSGIQNITWKFYIIFAVLNAFWLPWIYFFYVETAGLSLDEIDWVFEFKFAPGANMTYKEATRLAKERMEEGRNAGISAEEKDRSVEHVENKV